MKKFLPILLCSLFIACTSENQISKEARNHYDRAVLHFTGQIDTKQTVTISQELLDDALLNYNTKPEPEVDSALILINKAIRIEPDYYQAYVLKISILYLEKNYPFLLETYAELQRLEPKIPEWFFQEALLRLQMNDSTEAFKLFDKCLPKYETLFSEFGTENFYSRFQYLSVLLMADKQKELSMQLDQLKKDFPQETEFLDTIRFPSREEFMKTLMSE